MLQLFYTDKINTLLKRLDELGAQRVEELRACTKPDQLLYKMYCDYTLKVIAEERVRLLKTAVPLGYELID